MNGLEKSEFLFPLSSFYAFLLPRFSLYFRCFYYFRKGRQMILARGIQSSGEFNRRVNLNYYIL